MTALDFGFFNERQPSPYNMYVGVLIVRGLETWVYGRVSETLINLDRELNDTDPLGFDWG